MDGPGGCIVKVADENDLLLGHVFRDFVGTIGQFS